MSPVEQGRPGPGRSAPGPCPQEAEVAASALATAGLTTSEGWRSPG